MKKNLQLLYVVVVVSVLLISNVFNTYAQGGPEECPRCLPQNDSWMQCSSCTTSKARALFVNDFLKFNNGDVNDGVNEDRSILGVAPNTPTVFEYEDELFEWAHSRDFTELVLYDVEKALRNPLVLYDNQGSVTYLDHLVRFVKKAKDDGFVVTAFVSDKLDEQNLANYNGFDHDLWSQYGCDLIEPGDAFMGVNGNREYPEEIDPMEEIFDLMKRLYNYNSCWVQRREEISLCDENPSHSTNCTPTGSEFDRVLIESEFWAHKECTEIVSPNTTTHPEVCTEHYYAFQDVLSWAFSCIKPFMICPFTVDAYIGWLDHDELGDDDQAEWIDYHCDRLYIHAYQCRPQYCYGVSQERLDYMGTLGKANSDIWPLFSAESTCFPNPAGGTWGPFMGDFLTAGQGTMCCEEDDYQDQYDAYAATVQWDNEINGYAWFAYSFMKDNSIERKAKPNSLNNVSQSSISPNPASNELRISLITDKSSNKYNIKIFDVKGRLVQTKNNLSDNFNIDITNLTNGVYTIKIYDSISYLENKKFIVINDK